MQVHIHLKKFHPSIVQTYEHCTLALTQWRLIVVHKLSADGKKSSKRVNYKPWAQERQCYERPKGKRNANEESRKMYECWHDTPFSPPNPLAKPPLNLNTTCFNKLNAEFFWGKIASLGLCDGVVTWCHGLICIQLPSTLCSQQ